MTQYTIQITSDIVCPWCYIGHARLSKAIATHQQKYPTDTFHLKYLPYYLNTPPQLEQSSTTPAFPVQSVDKREFYIQKFGPQRVDAIFARTAQAAAADGLKFKFGGKTGVSRNGHRLVHWAQSHGGEKSQNEVMLGLWRRYFEQEVDITQLDVLVEIGLEAGLGTREEIREYLLSGKDGAAVDVVAEEQRMEGISGVPHYVIQDMWEVHGAQDPRAFESLFQRYKDTEKRQQGGNGSDGQGTACGPDHC